ncbi:hypothetical protein BJ546DRAFT_27930 [Cryomyces antarcticus]
MATPRGQPRSNFVIGQRRFISLAVPLVQSRTGCCGRLIPDAVSRASRLRPGSRSPLGPLRFPFRTITEEAARRPRCVACSISEWEDAAGGSLLPPHLPSRRCTAHMPSLGNLSSPAGCSHVCFLQHQSKSRMNAGPRTQSTKKTLLKSPWTCAVICCFDTFSRGTMEVSRDHASDPPPLEALFYASGSRCLKRGTRP